MVEYGNPDSPDRSESDNQQSDSSSSSSGGSYSLADSFDSNVERETKRNEAAFENPDFADDKITPSFANMDQKVAGPKISKAPRRSSSLKHVIVAGIGFDQSNLEELETNLNLEEESKHFSDNTLTEELIKMIDSHKE